MVTTKDLRTAVTEGMRRQIVFATTDILFFFLWNININYICKKKISVYSSDETQSTKQVYKQNPVFWLLRDTTRILSP